jgi:hypothetical protein
MDLEWTYDRRSRSDVRPRGWSPCSDFAEWCDEATLSEPLTVDNLDSRLAAHLGCPREDVHLRDLVVRPGSQQVVLSVMRGSGASAAPVLLTLTAEGKLRELPLDHVRFAQTPIEDAPLDMVAYSSDGQEYLLVSNVRHPLMKIACRDIDQQAPLTEPHQPVGVPRETLPQEGVMRMANLNGSHVLMLQRDDEGKLHLRPYATAAL